MAGASLSFGNQLLSETFTPSDSTYYLAATGAIRHQKAAPTITWATPTAIPYGTALSAAQLNATASVPGTFAYKPAAGTVLGAGAQILTITFTPTDTTDYNSAMASVTLMVNQVVPTISWATPGSISYGTALSAAQLNATASTPGSFAYTPPLGTVLKAGNQTLSVTFTPTDTTDYTTAAANVSLAVSQAAPTITWDAPTAIPYGTALSAGQLNATASVPGTFAYTPASGAVLGTGTQTLTATFTPTDTADYITATANMTLMVNQTVPTITWATPSAITFGTALSSAQLDATASAPGSFVYTPPLSTVLEPGSQTLSVTFTPTDTTDYTIATGDVQITAQIPVPTINQPLVPLTALPGANGFILTVNGTGFTPSSVVNWNGQARTTTFVSASQLIASILANDVSTAGTTSVTVVDPSSNGASNIAFFEVTNSVLPVSFSRTDLNVNAVPNEISTGRSSDSLIAADFNGDGKQDLAVANAGSGSVLILLGNGDGTFQALVSYNVGTNPQSMFAGDFNGDGKLDLAVANAGSGTVSTLLGNGDGTFQVPVSYNVGTNPQSVFAGDFDGDGKLDLAVGNAGSGTVSILLGNGDGTFQPHVDYPTSTNPSAFPTALAEADFNGDGKLDLAVTNSDNSAATLLGNGDGTFQSPVEYATGGTPSDVITADFNGDGLVDLAVANANSNSISILLGNGDGTFQGHVDYDVGNTPSGVVAGDFDGDGKLDLAVSSLGTGNVSVLLGNGDGTFQQATSYATASGPQSVVAADFNQDGRLDLAVTAPSSGVVSVLLQTPTVTLSSTTLSWGNQSVGIPSAAQTVTMSNTGSALLNLAAISLTGANAGNFAATNSCGMPPASLAPGASCSFSVTFTPSTIGAQGAMIAIADNAIGGSQMIALSGMTVNQAVPTLTWATPTAIAYGTALSAAQLNATASVPGTFAYTPAAGTVLGAGTQTLTVTFTPSDAVDNAMATANVTLTIYAPGPLTPGVSSFIFNTVNIGNTSTLGLILTNSGTTNITISNVSIAGPAFSVSGVFTGQIIPPGQTVALNGTFAPASAGSVTGSVTITSNASNSPVSIALSGVGVQPISHSVTLGWTASTSTVVGYNVYRAMVSGGPYGLSNSSLVTTAQYQDSSVQSGQTYFCVVTAVDSSGVESAYSNEVSVTIPTP